MTGTTASEVWIVDDDEAVRDSLVVLLECEGFAVRSFPSGPALLTEDAEPCGCLLLDLCMPDLDGFAVMAALRARDLHMPVIVVSAHGGALVERQVRGAGALALLDKPVDRETLIAAVRSGLGRSEHVSGNHG